MVSPARWIHHDQWRERVNQSCTSGSFEQPNRIILVTTRDQLLRAFLPRLISPENNRGNFFLPDKHQRREATSRETILHTHNSASHTPGNVVSASANLYKDSSLFNYYTSRPPNYLRVVSSLFLPRSPGIIAVDYLEFPPSILPSKAPCDLFEAAIPGRGRIYESPGFFQTFQRKSGWLRWVARDSRTGLFAELTCLGWV